MAESLEQVKARLSSKYLGKHGIHAIGMRRSEAAICVYLSSHLPAQRDWLRELEQQAAPFQVRVIVEPPPRAA